MMGRIPERVDGLGDGRCDSWAMPIRWWTSGSSAIRHTQLPRTIAAGGLASGGMDDRFDFQVTTSNMADGEGKVSMRRSSKDGFTMPLARHMADAYAAFNQAAMVTPDSLPGIAGRRLAAELCGQLPG